MGNLWGIYGESFHIWRFSLVHSPQFIQDMNLIHCDNEKQQITEDSCIIFAEQITEQ
jgi:hypothetical protein